MTAHVPNHLKIFVPENGADSDVAVSDPGWMLVADRWAIFAIALMLVGSFFFVPADPDLWGHLQFGLAHIESGNLATADPYAYTTEGQFWTNHEWMTEWAFGKCYLAAGAAGLLALRAVLLTVTVVLLMGIVRRRNVQGLWLLGTGFLLLTVLSGLFRVRPQMFSYAFAACLMAICDGYYSGKRNWLWLIPVMMVAWTNFHAGFVAGLGIFGFYWLSFVWAAWRADDRRELISLFLVMTLCCMATIVNPYGIYYWKYVLFAVALNRPSIPEWWPITQHNPMVIGYYLLMAVVPALLWIRNGIREGLKARPAEAFLFLLGVYMAAKHGRHLAFMCMFSMVFFASQFSVFCEKFADQFKSIANSRLAFSLLMLPVVVGGVSNLSTAAFSGQPKLFVSTQAYPVRAVEFLESNRISGNLDCGFTWGEYCLFRLKDQCKVFCDGRYETVYPHRVSELVLSLNDDPQEWAERVGEYPTEIIMLASHDKFAPWLDAQGEFVRVYEDCGTIVFVRDIEKFAGTIAKSKSGDLIMPSKSPGKHAFPG